MTPPTVEVWLRGAIPGIIPELQSTAHALLQALDGPDLTPIGLDGEEGAGLDRAVVQQHDAGAAAGGVTADVSAGQPDDLADEVDQQQTGLDLGAVLGPVDGDGDAHLPGAGTGGGSFFDTHAYLTSHPSSARILLAGGQRGVPGIPSVISFARSTLI